MSEFTLRLRRYDPESGEPPYWDEHTIELEPHRSVLEGILQAKGRFDGSIGIRCSCRAAICGSCGVRINGQPGLACHTHLDEALERSSDGMIEVEPMGNMPVIKDLIVDMDAVHWKKIQSVTPWLLGARAGARARVPRRPRGDGRRDAVDGLHPVRRLRLRLPGDGGRPRLHRPRRAGQGLPLRRRPARRRAPRAPRRARRGRARPLHLHALLQVRRRLPEGRQPDGSDHAPAPDRRLRLPHRGPQQRLPPRARVRQEHPPQRPAARGRPAAGLLRRQVQPARRARADRLAAGRAARHAARQDHPGQGAAAPAQGLEGAARDLRQDREQAGALRAEPLRQRHRRGQRAGGAPAPRRRR